MTLRPICPQILNLRKDGRDFTVWTRRTNPPVVPDRSTVELLSEIFERFCKKGSVKGNPKINVHLKFYTLDTITDKDFFLEISTHGLRRQDTKI